MHKLMTVVHIDTATLPAYLTGVELVKFYPNHDVVLPTDVALDDIYIINNY